MTPPKHIFDAVMDDGAHLKIRRGGREGATRLYLSNGNGFAMDGYRVFWEPLLSDFDVILFDARNHGPNDPISADRHTYFQMACDIGTVFHEVTKRLPPAKNVGVFHSMSGRAAMKHAVEMEWVWDALVLFDPPNVPPPGHPQYEAMKAMELKLAPWAVNRQETFTSPGELREFWTTNRAQARWLPEARDDMAKAVTRPDGKGGYTLSCRRELEALIYLAALSMDLWPQASAYGGPVKLIGADPNDPNGPAIGPANRALAEEGGYEYEFISDTGHLLQIERPDACRAAMLSFLRKHALA